MPNRSDQVPVQKSVTFKFLATTYGLLIVIFIELTGDFGRVWLDKIAVLCLSKNPANSVRFHVLLHHLVFPLLVANLLQNAIKIVIGGLEGLSCCFGQL